MKRYVIFVILIGVLAAFGLNRYIKANAESAQVTPSPLKVSVDVIKPTFGTMVRTVEVFGSLAPKNLTNIKSEIAGRVQHMRIKEWDRVRRGDPLLEIDPGDFKVLLNKSEAGLNMARAQLLQAKVDLNRAKRERDRALKLKESGLITGQDLDERKTAVESAEARVALAQAQVGQAESQIAEAKLHLGKTNICAPIDGVVSLRKVDVGDFVDKGNLLFCIVDNRVLDFTANVAATDLSLVKEGQMLTFTVDGLPERAFQGHIKRVNPMVSDTDRSGRIIAEVNNEDGALKGGVYARGKIVVEEHPNAMILPKAALMLWDLDKGAAKVFIVDEAHSVHARDVTTGLTADDRVEIKTGISGSELVVIRGGFNIREGDLVSAMEEGKGN